MGCQLHLKLSEESLMQVRLRRLRKGHFSAVAGPSKGMQGGSFWDCQRRVETGTSVLQSPTAKVNGQCWGHAAGKGCKLLLPFSCLCPSAGRPRMAASQLASGRRSVQIEPSIPEQSTEGWAWSCHGRGDTILTLAVSSPGGTSPAFVCGGINYSASRITLSPDSPVT